MNFFFIHTVKIKKKYYSIIEVNKFNNYYFINSKNKYKNQKKKN